MAANYKSNLASLLADGALAVGNAVKAGSDNDHCAIGAANTDKCFGLVQNTVDAAEDVAEIAFPGGGGKGLLGETVAAGDYLVSHTDGSLVKANAAGDHVCAMALRSGVSGDVIDCLVVCFEAYDAE